MSQANNRITGYHWYLGSAFWRERREPPLPQSILDRRDAGRRLRVILRYPNQYCDPPHPLGLLRRCPNWPRHRASKSRDELAPFSSLDHLVGALLEMQWHVDAERGGSPEIDHKLIFCWKLYREIGWLCSLQYSVNVGRA